MKKPTLIPAWRRVLARSWSVWLGAYLPVAWLAGVEALYALAGLEVNPRVVWLVALALPSVVPLVRIIDQGIASGAGR